MFLLRLYTILYCIPDELFIRSSHHRKKEKRLAEIIEILFRVQHNSLAL